MTNKEKLTILIIEAIHWLPYEVAKNIENWSNTLKEWQIYFKTYPITIWRVIQALRNKRIEYGKSVDKEFDINVKKLCDIWEFPVFKKFKNWQECTLEDQTDETIEFLLKLFN